VTLSEIKGQLNMAPDDDSRDGRLLSLAKAATNLAERVTGRSLLTQTWRLALDWGFYRCHWYDEIVLPRPPVQSITSVQYTDPDGATQTLDAAKYKLSADSQPATLAPTFGESWPATQHIREAVRITYVAGGLTPADVPEDAKLGILLAVQSWFDMPFAAELVLPAAALALLRSLKVGTYAPSYPV
jgi:uncharacterized phiE125 gp8 family phage protein